MNRSIKKVLIFGSGNGAKEYLQKFSNQMEVLAILDNNKKKHGTKFLDRFNILDPGHASSIECDEIIIVSQWAKDIYKQLVESLHIDPKKITIPIKSDIKETIRPFEDEKTKELARKIIKGFSFYAIKENIPLLLDFGTLLGLVRDGDVIKWDDDIDFAIINTSSMENLEDWIDRTIKRILLPVNLQCTSTVRSGKVVDYTLHFTHKKHGYKYRKFSTSISLRENIDGYSIHVPSNGMWYAPTKFFSRYQSFAWNEVSVLVPYDYKNYLTFVYGDWTTPKHITMADYANLGINTTPLEWELKN
jgi:lipopolysaccharide cholinephosphotransferase